MAWSMYPLGSGTSAGWVINEVSLLEIHKDKFAYSFPDWPRDWEPLAHLPDPTKILGSYASGLYGQLQPWTRTNPLLGNRWRTQANGARVYAFPLWLYCDDTSGNLSKKWNKHNSFLFTPAGLPQHHVHQEYNIHFLCTSNIAPPLEMLDGIVQQLE
jgi:hypothetical protein